MSGKRCHDDSHNCVPEDDDDQRSSRPRHDFQNNINIHTELGYESQDKIAFHDVFKLEKPLDLKIVIFHRSSSGKLEVYKN